MTIKYLPPASIEAEKATAITRRFESLTPQKNKLLGLTFPFKFDRNSEISITKELSPKEAKIDKTSMLNKDDGLKGDAISGFTLKALKPDLIHGSSTHKASLLLFNKFVYAKLYKSFAALEGKAQPLLT
jgi:hypothetical protein